MTCETVEPELVAYHFGTCALEARQGVEDHLLGCSNCLRVFLTVKRDIETGEADPLPSEAARERLRLAVRQHLRAPVREWRWWEKPFAFSFAGITVAAAVLAVYVVSVGPGSAPRALGDQVQSPAQSP